MSRCCLAGCLLLVAVLAIAADVQAAGAGGSSRLMRMPSPPRLDANVKGRVLGSTYESSEPVLISLSLWYGFGHSSVRLKTLFGPGDLRVNVDRLIGIDRSGVAAERQRTLTDYDPVKAAFDRYRVDHPKARLLPTPADAWFDATEEVADIPIKARCVPDGSPDGPTEDLDCGLLPLSAFATEGLYEVTITCNLPAPSRWAEFADGRARVVIAAADAMTKYEQQMTATRAEAEFMMAAQAREVLGVEGVKVVRPVRLVGRSTSAGMYYDATYSSDEGSSSDGSPGERRTVNLRLFGDRPTPPTISIDGGPVRWPISRPASLDSW